jgi:hypothetical protein
MSHTPILAAALVALVLGVRHGLDWDHLAAITDLVGAAEAGRRRRSLGLALWYCIGHGLVIVLLGALVGVFGVRLPGGIDRVFEIVVGVTLVGLGLLVLWQVWRQKAAYRFTSRWRLLLDLLRRVWLRRRGRVAWDAAAPLSKRTAFGIGVLHGTGAETPTQVVLFGSAAAAGAEGGTWLVLLAFVAGLVVCDVAVAGLWAAGRLSALRVPGLQLVLGVITGVASVAVGAPFILERSSLLPALFGG